MELPGSWSTASASAPWQLLVVQAALLSVVVGGRDSLDSKLRSSQTLAVIVFVTNIGVVFLCTAQTTRYSSSVICGLDGSSCVWRVERTQSHMGSCRRRSALRLEGAEAAFLVRVSSRLVRYISVTQAHHPKQPLRLAGWTLTVNLRSKSKYWACSCGVDE